MDVYKNNSGNYVIQDGVKIQLWQNELIWLQTQASQYMSILEIGSGEGGSTRALCKATRGIVTAVDPFVEDNKEAFLENTKDCKNLRLFEMTSEQFAKKGEVFDMIFIDGAHDYENIYLDISIWLPRAKYLICGHDWRYTSKGVLKAVAELVPSFKLLGVYEGRHSTIWYKTI